MPSAKGQLYKYRKKKTAANLKNFWKQEAATVYSSHGSKYKKYADGMFLYFK